MLPKVRIRACRYAACFDNRATSRRTKLQSTPLLRTSTCGGPSSQTRPACSTTIRSKLRKLDSRCAIAMTVRPPIKRSNAWRTASSESLSSAEVASSSRRIGASLRNARAMPMRCRCPGDSFTPVCTENLIRIDCVTESPNVNGDERALLPLPDPVRLAVQVEEPTWGRERGAPSSTDCAAAQGAGSRPAHKWGSLVLGPAVSMVSVGPQGHHDHPARDARALASSRLPSVLALEIPLSWRPTEDRCGTARVDPADKRGKSLVGSAAYSWRAAQARLRGRSVQRRKVLARHRPHEGAAGRMIESAQCHTHRRGCDHQAYKKRATEEHWPAQVGEFRYCGKARR